MLKTALCVPVIVFLCLSWFGVICFCGQDGRNVTLFEFVAHLVIAGDTGFHGNLKFMNGEVCFTLLLVSVLKCHGYANVDTVKSRIKVFELVRANELSLFLCRNDQRFCKGRDT